MDIKSGIVIGFSTASHFNLISRSIRLAEGTAFSHVYTRFYDPSIDRWMIYHASHSDLHFTNMECFLAKNKVIEEFYIDVDHETRERALQYCVDRVEIPYGRLQLVGMLIVRLAKLWFNKSIKNPFHDGESTQVCSELVAHLLKIIGEDIDLKLVEVEGPKWINKIMHGLVDKGSAVNLGAGRIP